MEKTSVKTSVTKRRSKQHSFSIHSRRSGDNEIQPGNFGKLQFAIEKYATDYNARQMPMLKEFQEQDNGKKSPLGAGLTIGKQNDLWAEKDPDIYPPVVIFYDKEFYLRKIQMQNTRLEKGVFPALVDSFARFDTLLVLRIDYCNLTSEDIEHLKNLLQHDHITIKELSLKGTANNCQNCDILLTKYLEILSFRLCGIGDIAMPKIGKWFQENSLETNLVYLDLSSNMIFDENVGYLVDILACNRKLKYLNIADCKITDESCQKLMKVFDKFPLGPDEIYQRRKIRFDYYKALEDAESGNGEKTENNNELSDQRFKSTVSEMTERLNNHPFTDENNIFSDMGQLWCKGNSTLNCLNVSYNRFTKETFKTILEILNAQKTRFGNTQGLLRLLLDGTDYQKHCQQEIEDIQQLLTDKLINRVSEEQLDEEDMRPSMVPSEAPRKVRKSKETRSSAGSNKKTSKLTRASR